MDEATSALDAESEAIVQEAGIVDGRTRKPEPCNYKNIKNISVSILLRFVECAVLNTPRGVVASDQCSHPVRFEALDRLVASSGSSVMVVCRLFVSICEVPESKSCREEEEGLRHSNGKNLFATLRQTDKNHG